MTGQDALTCGVDEAGRGPLAGPVFAAAVILDPARPIAGIADSKTLTARRRELLAAEIRARALAWGVASAAVEEIDAINILQASLLAMRRAVEALAIAPTEAWVDGVHCPRLEVPARAIVGGDATHANIAAASILAKVARDEAMRALHRIHPVYGFDRHKGYPTAAHLAALRAHGVCAAHRRSFEPVRRLLTQPSVPPDAGVSFAPRGERQEGSTPR
jgi:ribonuclease HII